MKIEIKKLKETAVVPTYAHDDDACFDLYAASREIDEHGNIVYGIGIAFAIPKGYYLQIQPRSSNTKKNLVMLNSPGIVDSGYRGEVSVKYRYISGAIDARHIYEVGERVAQGVILPCPHVAFVECDELSETERGAGGYGSTGK